MFDKAEQETSSAFRKLLAILVALQAFESILTGCNEKFLTEGHIAENYTYGEHEIRIQ